MAASPLLSAAHYRMTITLCWKHEREQTELWIFLHVHACMHAYKYRRTHVYMPPSKRPHLPLLPNANTFFTKPSIIQ